MEVNIPTICVKLTTMSVARVRNFEVVTKFYAEILDITKSSVLKAYTAQ